MFDEKGMLTDRARGILFWMTIFLIGIVAIVAIVTIVRSCSRVISQMQSPPLVISPAEASLCAGEQQPFTVADGVEASWEATGGAIDGSGLFTAGSSTGDFTVTAIGSGSGQTAEAIVHVVACTPTATPVPSPTPTPAATPTPEAATSPSADPQGDVGTYETGAPVEGVPAGVDIRAASISPDMQVVLQPDEVPQKLTGWAGEDEALLWIELHSPIPNPPTIFTDWLFSLDLDGDTGTGRPVGSARINPDLGDEAVIGVSYNPAVGSFEPYFLAWNSASGEWESQEEEVRFYLDDSRTLVALALPLESLTQAVSDTASVSLSPEAVRGRLAVLSYVGEQAVIDFYPPRP